jgi:phage shock protein A
LDHKNRGGVFVSSDEEFQRTVLEEFKKLNERIGNLEHGQESLKQGQAKLEQRQENLEHGQAKLEKGQDSIKMELKDIVAQTANLTEFRVEMNTKLNKVIKDVGTVEIVTSKNWNDLAWMKSVK